MSAISWDGLETFTSPASTSIASSGDNWFRSFLSSVARGLATSYIWPGSGGGSAASAGMSQFGNLRFARASNSATTGGFGNGFLLLNTNHISLHHSGSSWTGMLAHSAMVDHGGGLGSAPFTGRWVTQLGGFTPVGFPSPSTTTNVIFNPVYAAVPFLQFTQSESSNGYAINISSLTTGGFTAEFSGLRGTCSGTITWESNGTI